MNAPIRLPANASLAARKDAATPRGVGVMAPIFAARAENSEIWDVEGRRYIDFAGGIAVLNTGHRHPKVMRAVAAQLERFTHTCYQVIPYEGYVALAEKLNALVPGDFAKKSLFVTTGAEAVENAVKIARVATGRTGIVAFAGGFHGRTMMGMALTGKVAPYKIGFGPFPSEVYHAGFPTREVGTTAALASLVNLFKTDIDPARVAAIIIEPVQGEGGFSVAPAPFLAGLRQLCDAHGILLIADEIQSGFGRTGKWFAMEHAGISADLVTTAKSLAGGFPLAAVTGRAEVMDAAAPGGLGGTYAGSPVALAAALAVIEVIEQEALLDRAARLGLRLVEFLESLRPGVSAMSDVRGLGSMVALELSDPATGAPDAAFAKRIQACALERGLILLTCGTAGNVIRFLYPLTIGDALFGEALAIIGSSIREALGAGD